MKVNFYLAHYESPGKANYQHQSIVLAEGFETMGGIDFRANIDYWQLDRDKMLFNKGLFKYPELSIYSAKYIETKDTIADDSSIKVLIDSSDGRYTLAHNSKHRHFDLILKSHYLNSDQAVYNRNVIPWTFGLSNRMIKGIDKNRSGQKKRVALLSYRVKQNVRTYYNKQIQLSGIEAEEFTSSPDEQNTSFDWVQSGKRHNDDYYKKINSVSFLPAYGGHFGHKKNNFHLLRLAYGKVISDISYYFTHYQWDSWRLWESFYADCVPIFCDFDKWGFRLPSLPPTHMKQYLGTAGNPKSDLRSYQQLSEQELDDINEQGKVWVIKNYTPAIIAQRLLDQIKA